MGGLELHRTDEIDQFVTDAHRGDERRSLAVGLGDATLRSGRDQLRRRVTVNGHGEPGIMDSHRCIGSNFARRRAEKQIPASRIAHRMIGHDVSLNFAASRLDFQAGIIDLRSRTTGRHNGTPDPGDSLPATQQAPDDKGLFDRAARRMEIDRALRILHIAQETANASGRPLVDFALNGNPAVATGPA